MKRLVYGGLVVMLAGCGESMATAPGGRMGGTGGGGGGEASGSVTVSVGTNFFRSGQNGSMNSAVDTIPVGGKVTWRWAGAGSVPHNVASVGTPSFTSGAVKTGDGSTYEVTFTSPGTYRYNCAIHGNLMTGVVVVTAQQLETIEVSASDSVLVPGSSTQLTVIGRDARGRAVGNLTGITFSTTNPFNTTVSPTGLVTALFSTVRPSTTDIIVEVPSDGGTFVDSKRIQVVDPSPAGFQFSALMEPQNVRPFPTKSAGEGIVFFTRNGPRIDYQLYWSLLNGPPLTARIHGPDGRDAPAEILVDLPVARQLNTNGTMRGSFSAEDITPQRGERPISIDSLVRLMQTPGMLSMEMATAFFRTGEIRGSIVQRP